MANRHPGRPPSRPELLWEGQTQIFFCFEICYSPKFHLSKMGSYFIQLPLLWIFVNKRFCQNFVKTATIWTFNHSKFAKNHNLENHRLTMLYHPKVYVQTKFQQERTCKFLYPFHFMSKLITSSTKCISSYI